MGEQNTYHKKVSPTYGNILVMYVGLSDQIKNKVERRNWRRLLVHILRFRISGSPHYLESQHPLSCSQDNVIYLEAGVSNFIPQLHNLLF
jgi:hypothetical protein